MILTPQGNEFLPLPRALVISEKDSSSASKVLQFAVGKEPTMPAREEAITSLALDTINIGA